MMRPYLFLPLSFLLSLNLTACAPTRENADNKLAVACAASIKATFSDVKDHIEVKNADFNFAKSYDGFKLRVVKLKAKYTYGSSAPDDKIYTCTYTEEWSPFSYLPEFYNMQRDDQKYGNFNGTIMGDVGVLLKITEANERAFH